MMTEIFQEPLFMLILLLFIIFLAPFVFQRFKLPGILGLLFCGMLIGPNTLDIIKIDQNILLLQEIGLLTLMFNAALEIDIQQFKQLKLQTMLYVFLSFSTPFIISFLGGIVILKLPVLNALFVGVVVSSHTLVALPLLTKHRVMDRKASLLAIASTLITDTAALTVLSLLTMINRNEGQILTLSFYIFLLSTSLFFVLLLYLLPKLAKKLFQHPITTDNEFIFVILTMFFCAGIAYLIGLEPIVGAFLCGLALNQLIPKESRLMQKVDFIGNTLFTPIFLIYIGMLIDVSVFLSSFETLQIVIMFTIAVFLGKWLASFILKQVLALNFSEQTLIFALTIPQVGATLATIFIGMKIELLNNAFLNAGIVLLVITSVVSQITVDKVAPSVAEIEETESDKEYGIHTVLTVVPHEFDEGKIQNTLDFASLFLPNPMDTLCPLSVSTLSRTSERTAEQSAEVTLHEDKEQKDKIQTYVAELSSELQCKTQCRKSIDTTQSDAILTTGIEIKADLALVNVKEENKDKQYYYFSDTVDVLLKKTVFPIGLCQLQDPLNVISNIVLLLDSHDFEGNKYAKTLRLVKRLAKSLSATIEILDTGYLPENNVKMLLDEIIDPKLYTYYKFHNIMPKSNKVLSFTGYTDLIVGTIPSYHPVFYKTKQYQSTSYVTLPSFFKQNSFLFLYYAEKSSVEAKETEEDTKRAVRSIKAEETEKKVKKNKGQEKKE